MTDRGKLRMTGHHKYQETHQIQDSQRFCQSEIQLFIPNRIQAAINDLGLCSLIKFN